MVFPMAPVVEFISVGVQFLWLTATAGMWHTNHVWVIVGCRIDINALQVRGKFISQLDTRELGRLVNTLRHLSVDLTDGE